MSIKAELNGDWLGIINFSATKNRELINIEFEKPDQGKLGKYLFFSDDKEALFKLGKEILEKHNLYLAKIPSTDTPRKSKGFGFVLCIYDSFPGLTSELTKYADGEKIKYRYWKSNKKSLNGEYSKNFLRGSNEKL